MEKTKKLSLAELKAKAEVAQQSEILQKMGGATVPPADWCHSSEDQATKLFLKLFSGGVINL